MASLYEINNKLLDALARAELEAIENDGEIEEATCEELDRLEMDRAEKIENTALYIKNLSAEIAMIKAEEDNLKARRLTLQNRVDNIRDWLKFNLHGESMKTGAFAISYRKSTAVEIQDEGLITSDYLNVVKSVKVDKVAIKKAIMAGKVVEGASVIEKQNLIIK